VNGVLPYAVALAAALPATLATLGLWVGHSRLVDGDGVDSVFLAYVFLFVSLIFFVSVAANAGAIAVGQLAALVAPELGRPLTILAAGVLVVALCAWTQRGTFGWGRRSAPLSALPVALFAGADMLILAGGLSLLPHTSTGA